MGFIEIKDGPNGPISYILILNPYHVVKALYEDGKVNSAFFNALNQRMIEIRARDLEAAVSTEEKKSQSDVVPRKKLKRRS